MSTGEIVLENFKVTFYIEDPHLVDSKKLESANDSRLYYEVSFGIGLTMLGAELQEHNKWLLISTVVFLVFGLFFLVRYVLKNKTLQARNRKEKKS